MAARKKTTSKNKLSNPFPEFKAKDKRDVIGNVVSVSKSDYSNPRFWSREMKLIGELLSEYPNPKFLQSLDFGFKLNSLAWLKTVKGKQALKRKWDVFNYVPPKEEEKIILGDKVGKSIIEKAAKPKQTMMEFLDG